MRSRLECVPDKKERAFDFNVHFKQFEPGLSIMVLIFFNAHSNNRSSGSMPSPTLECWMSQTFFSKVQILI